MTNSLLQVVNSLHFSVEELHLRSEKVWLLKAGKAGFRMAGAEGAERVWCAGWRYTAQLRSWEINIKCYKRRYGEGEEGKSGETETDMIKWGRRK